MYPVLFRIGEFEITSFGVLVALAVLVGLWMFTRECRRAGLAGHAEDAALAGVFGGLAGAKIVWTIEHVGREGAFFDLLLSRGGLELVRRVCRGLLAGIVVMRRRGLSVLAVLAAATPALAVAHAIGRIGCFLVGDDYGVPSGLPWAVAFPRACRPRPCRCTRRSCAEALALVPLAWLLHLVAARRAFGRVRPGRVSGLDRVDPVLHRVPAHARAPAGALRRGPPAGVRRRRRRHRRAGCRRPEFQFQPRAPLSAVRGRGRWFSRALSGRDRAAVLAHNRTMTKALAWMRTLWLPILLAVYAPAVPAGADVVLLLAEPYGRSARFNPTGHVGVYLTRVCADDPVTLRRCREGEAGAVISRYNRVGGLDWAAIPLIPYLYGVEQASDVPEFASPETVRELRESYRRAHLSDLIPDLEAARDKHWFQLVGSVYDRQLVAVSVPTTPNRTTA